MRSGTIVLALAAALVAAPVGVAEPTAQQLVAANQKAQAGMKALESGDLATARKRFEQALEMVPYQPDALLGLGHLQLREKRLEDALASYRNARDGYVKLRNARADFETDAYGGNMDQIEDMRLSEAQVGRGTIKQSGGAERSQALKREKSAQDARRAETPAAAAHAEDPSGRIDFFVGTALFQLQRVDEAVREWETCLGKTPGFAPVYNNLVLGYWRLGRLPDALAVLDRAEERGLAVNPQLAADVRKAAAK